MGNRHCPGCGTGFTSPGASEGHDCDGLKLQRQAKRIAELEEAVEGWRKNASDIDNHHKERVAELEAALDKQQRYDAGTQKLIDGGVQRIAELEAERDEVKAELTRRDAKAMAVAYIEEARREGARKALEYYDQMLADGGAGPTTPVTEKDIDAALKEVDGNDQEPS